MSGLSVLAQARRHRLRISTVKKFYMHAFFYIIVNFLILSANVLIAPQQLWFFIPLLLWGVALAAHGIAVFGWVGLFSLAGREEELRRQLHQGHTFPKAHSSAR